MVDEGKTKEELIKELTLLRSLLAEGSVSAPVSAAPPKNSDKRQKDRISENHIRDVIGEILRMKENAVVKGQIEERFAKAFLNNATPMAITSIQDGRYIDVSDSFSSLMGLKRQEIIGSTSVGIGFITQEQRTLFINEFHEKGCVENMELEVNTKDRSMRYGLFNSSKITLGKEDYLLTVVTNITQRKEAEDRLRASEENYRLHFMYASDVIYSLDRNFILCQVSPTMEWLLGYTPEELIGNRIQDLKLFTPESCLRAIEDARKVFAGETAGLKEYEFIDCSGKRKLCEISVSPLYQGGEITRIISIARDITERRYLEEDLLRARKLESVGLLAGGIAHDYNNILAVLQGYVDLLKLDLDPESRAHHRLIAAEQAIRQATELTMHLIVFSQGGAPIKKLCQIDEIVKDTIQRRFDATPVEKIFFAAEDLRPAEIDEGQIRQVVRNLTMNALEAMPEGGTLRVGVENTVVTGKDRLPLPEGAYIRISFQDTGSGISKEDLPHIFDPYFSTKQRGHQKGMGLGLSVCHAVVTRHDGFIAVATDAAKGTTFFVYLPVAVQGRIAATSPVRGKKTNLRKRILIMDDEVMIREMAKELMTVMGYDVETAANGQEAVALYTGAKVNRRPFDMVILDLTVKGGMGGKRTMERLREIDPSVRAIILSGYSDDQIIQDYDNYGFVGALTKPFTAETLQAFLEKNL